MTIETLPHAEIEGTSRKLRDSCRACASSKVKCRKEKPACSRCTKRGIACEYLPTKRGGRKLAQAHSPSPPRALTRDVDSGHSCRSRSTSAATVPESDAGSVTMAPQLQSPSLASWFTSDAMHPISGTTTPSLMTSVEPDPMQYNDSTFGATTDPFSRVFTSGHHPTTVLPEMTTDSQYIHTSSSFPFMDLDMEAPEPDFLNMGQLEFFPTSIDSWRLDNNTSMSRSPMHSMSQGPEDVSYTEADLFNMQNTSAQTSPPLFGTRFASPEKARRSPSVIPPDTFSCSCMAQALGLIKQLFPSSSQGFTSGATPASIHQQLRRDEQSGASCFPGLSIEAVIAQNDATIEATSHMLQCSCSEDDYLLVITSLIVLKVLGWYAAVARRAPTPQSMPTSDSSSNVSTASLSSFSASGAGTSTTLSHSSSSTSLSSSSHQQPQATSFGSLFPRHSETVVRESTVIIDSYRLDGDDSARMAAQLVLSKLHRVQRLVNQLSQKLKAQAEKRKRIRSDSSDNILNGFFGGVDSADAGAPLPLSFLVLDQLEADLRRRLKSLSAEIVDELRRDQSD
jgi:hypothetical protein